MCLTRCYNLILKISELFRKSKLKNQSCQILTWFPDMLLNLLLSHSYLMYSFLFSYLFISYHIFFIHLIYFHYQVLHNMSGSSKICTFQLRIFGFPKLLHDWVCASRALVRLSDKQHSSFEQCTDTVLPNLTPFLLCNLSNS